MNMKLITASAATVGVIAFATNAQSATHAAAQSSTPTPIITTVAGSGRPFRGNNGPALQAGLGQTFGMAFDSKGNLYVCDVDHEVVVRITPSGTVSIVAGNGQKGLSGDGGPATQASLYTPLAVAIDHSDNLYIADLDNNRVRKVSVDGIITTYGGGGQSDVNRNPVEGIAATQTVISPNGIALDGAGNVYVSDGNHSLIRKIRTDGTIVTAAGSATCDPAHGCKPAAAAGDGGPATSAGLNFATGLAIDAAGNLYIGEQNGHRVRKVTTDGIIHRIAGTGDEGQSGDGGPAIDATLFEPNSLFVDVLGNVYIGDLTGNRVRRVTSDGKIATVAGSASYGFAGDNGPAVNASLENVGGVTGDSSGNLYVADRFNGRVRKVNSGGIITTIAGNGAGNFFGDNGTANKAGLNAPMGVAVGPDDTIYIADTHNNRIRRVTKDGIISTLAGAGAAGFGGDNGPATSALLNEPNAVAVDQIGNVYVADTNNGRIRKIDKDGKITTFAGGSEGSLVEGGQATSGGISDIVGVAVDANNNVYIPDPFACRVYKVNPSGIITAVLGNGQCGYSGDGGPATAAAIRPVWVSVDRAGNLYISGPMAFPSWVRKVDTHGIISRIAGDDGQHGSGEIDPSHTLATQLTLESCTNVAFDGSGNLYVGTSIVYTIAPDGKIAYLVNNHQATLGFRGDGGPAISALLGGPTALATDSKHDLYIADAGNDRIRKVIIHPPTRLLNISTRLQVGTGSNVLIGGFIITGTDQKKVVVRALGPSLGAAGIQGALANPVLELHNAKSTVASNDDWKTTQQAEIAGTGIPPNDDLEAAIVRQLPPASYTAVLSGKNQTTGVGLVELYDLDQAANSQLANISTRGMVDKGENVLIGGFIVGHGVNTSPKVLVRAIGPSLAGAGVQGALLDPTLELHNSDGASVAFNDDWRDSQEQAITDTTIPPRNDKESAIVKTLNPGAYTAIVRGKNDTTGVGLVEAYFLQ